MDLEKDQAFFYLAKEGLKAQLPEGWKACQKQNGDMYYFNDITSEITWDHPLDSLYRTKF